MYSEVHGERSDQGNIVLWHLLTNLTKYKIKYKVFKIASERVHFGDNADYGTAGLLKKRGNLSQTFFKDFVYRFNLRNYRTVILKKTFLIRTIPMAIPSMPAFS